MATRRRKSAVDLRPIHTRSAGIDIGAASHWVAVDPSLSDGCVRTFGTYTDDLHALAEWLCSLGVRKVAMESTGVYWIPVYQVLRDRGLDVCLVDARATKQVAGRKTDLSDCQWIQQLHSYGLLKPAFIPDADDVHVAPPSRLR